MIWPCGVIPSLISTVFSLFVADYVTSIYAQWKGEFASDTKNIHMNPTFEFQFPLTGILLTHSRPCLFLLPAPHNEKQWHIELSNVALSSQIYWLKYWCNRWNSLVNSCHSEVSYPTGTSFAQHCQEHNGAYWELCSDLLKIPIDAYVLPSRVLIGCSMFITQSRVLQAHWFILILEYRDQATLQPIWIQTPVFLFQHTCYLHVLWLQQQSI